MIPTIDLPAQYQALKPEIDAAIASVLESCQFFAVEEFEKAFAEYCGVKHAIGCSSGTSALELALRACGVGLGDEVIVPAFTFIATAEAVSNVGAKPVFVDIDSLTYLMDLSLVEERITERTKAIIPVHLYGQPVDMGTLMAMADKRGIAVIEDAAQAHGALYKGRKAGSLGDLSCFSFYPTKNLGAYGDAGAVTTNDGKLAESVRLLKNHGRTAHYEHGVIGSNCRMDAIQAAILSVKLKHLDKWNERRRDLAALYDEMLEDTDVITPVVSDKATHVYHLYPVRSKKRNELAEYLRSKEIQVGLSYPIPLHLQKAYEHLKRKEGDFPVAERLAKEVLCLPLYPEMTEAQLGMVVKAIREFDTQRE